MITKIYNQEVADIDKQLENNKLSEEERAKLLLLRNEMELALLETFL